MQDPRFAPLPLPLRGEIVRKANPYHGADGRFTDEGGGAGGGSAASKPISWEQKKAQRGQARLNRHNQARAARGQGPTSGKPLDTSKVPYALGGSQGVDQRPTSGKLDTSKVPYALGGSKGVGQGPTSGKPLDTSKVPHALGGSQGVGQGQPSAKPLPPNVASQQKRAARHVLAAKMRARDAAARSVKSLGILGDLDICK